VAPLPLVSKRVPARFPDALQKQSIAKHSRALGASHPPPFREVLPDLILRSGGWFLHPRQGSGRNPARRRRNRHPGSYNKIRCHSRFARNQTLEMMLRENMTWVLEGSLAGFLVRHDMALELVCGADFSWKLMCRADPGDLGAPRGSDSAGTRGKTGPRISSQTALIGYLKAVWRAFSFAAILP